MICYRWRRCLSPKYLPATSTSSTSENRITRASHSTAKSPWSEHVTPRSVSDRFASMQRTLAEPVPLLCLLLDIMMRSIFLGGTSPDLKMALEARVNLRLTS